MKPRDTPLVVSCKSYSDPPIDGSKSCPGSLRSDARIRNADANVFIIMWSRIKI
jgi:hypothetical protein